MKKFLLIFTATCLLISCSNKKTFQISGTLTDFGNPDDPTMLYLKTRTVDDLLINLDSTYLAKDGKFVLKGKSTETDLFFLADKDNVFVISIFIDPANKITVSGSATDYNNIKIEGSKTQMFYNQYLSMIALFQEEQDNIEQNFNNYLQDTALSEEVFQKIKEGLIAEYEKLEAAIEATTIDFIRLNPNSIVAAYLAYRNVNMLETSAEIEQQLQLLDSTMDNKFTILAKGMLERVKQTEVGSVLVNIELPDAEGKLISLSSLRGKYVLVDFWATWCSPCVREIPNLKKIYQKYHEKGFEIYSISLDYSNEAWLNGIVLYELDWITVTDLMGSPTAKQMAIKYIPHTFLLDPDGVIVAVNLREGALENKLEELIR